MRWDEPVEAYLPKFKLAGERKEPNERATPGAKPGVAANFRDSA
jgi:hypothetical protein